MGYLSNPPFPGGSDAIRNVLPGEAKRLMEREPDCVVLDVRERVDHERRRIPGSLCIPFGELEAKAADLLPDKGQLILVHCYAGVRSKSAARLLAKLGYRCIVEFGGISHWPYETVGADAETR